MKIIPVIKTILKITVVATVIFCIGAVIHNNSLADSDYSWILVLILFLKLIMAVFRILGIVVKTVISLILSTLKLGFILYLITLIL